MVTDVDIYDGHVLETTDEGEDELWHIVHHPDHCHRIDWGGGFIDYDCAITFVTNSIGDEPWDEHDTPGWRIIGWRHDTYGGRGRPIEHDVVCWALPARVDHLIPKEAHCG